MCKNTQSDANIEISATLDVVNLFTAPATLSFVKNAMWISPGGINNVFNIHKMQFTVQFCKVYNIFTKFTFVNCKLHI